MRLRATLVAAVSALFPATATLAEVTIWIDISDQTLKIGQDGVGLYQWPVSTGRPGFPTPTGVFTPQWLDADHRSAKYNNAPMPWSIFYYGGVAIHGTDQIAQLGTPASAGCVRLHPEHAKVLYDMVMAEGLAQTRVIVRQ